MSHPIAVKAGKLAVPTEPRYARAAEVVAGSFDAEANTVDVIWTTGAAVLRSGWNDAGERKRFSEILSLDPTAVDLARLNNGAPFLAQHSLGGFLSHGREQLGDVLGKVVEGSAVVGEGRGTAKIVFSRRPDVAPIIGDVRDGILRNISVGYNPQEWVDRETPSGLVERTITRWTPYELSAVAMGADDGAKFRSHDERGDEPPEGRHMPATQTPTPAEPTNVTPPVALATVPANVPVLVDPAVERAAGFAEATARMSSLLNTVRRLKLDANAADVSPILADATRSTTDAREALMELAASRDDKPHVSGVHSAGVQLGLSEIEARSDAMASAILFKADGARHALSDAAREFGYAGYRMRDYCGEALRLSGRKYLGLPPHELIRQALELRTAERLVTRAGYHTTSDFPLLLGDAIQKSLRKAYDESPATHELWTKRSTAPDFKEVKRIMLSAASNLLIKVEGGQVTYGTLTESRERYALATYARAIAMTREMMINDDLNAFGTLPVLFANAARRLEADTVWAVLTANAAMADGVALFHATHANLTNPGAAPSITEMNKGFTAMAIQTGLAGEVLNIQPRFVLTPVGLQLPFAQLLDTTGQYVTDSKSNKMPGYMSGVTVIAEPRLDVNSATRWYMAADPMAVDTIERLYLEGQEGMRIETEQGFEVDGIKTKVTLDFAAKALDWRGLYRNGA